MKITIDFFHTDGKKTFKSKEELLTFLSKEREYWNIFFQGQNQNTINSIKQDLFHQLDSAIQLANSITENEDSIQRATSQISTKYQNLQLIKFEGAKAKFALSFKEINSLLSCYLIGYFTNKLYNQANDALAFRAIFEGLKYENGITGNVDSEKEALNALKIDWETKLSDIQSNFDDTNTQVNTIKSEIENYFTVKKQEFEQFRQDRENEFKTLIHTYDDKLALQAPVDYWSERSSLNYYVSLILGIVFLFAMMVLIGNFESMAKNVSISLEAKNYYPLLQFGTLAVIGLWLMRILVKIFYSKLHLAEEAKEKEMFIKTYLALLRDSKGVKEEDRHLILQSIFSPSKNGIIQDDGVPANFIENIIKANR
ncbi:MAG: hypothetical protein EOM55_04765 [Clostridia bacterium]|nr:hypothetical protein [Clostridia bacterium]